MTKNRFILLLLAATIAASYFYSRPVYDFYTQTYYLKVKKITPEQTLRHVQKLYEQKNYDELLSYTKKMLIVFPDNKELKPHYRYGQNNEGDRRLTAPSLLSPRFHMITPTFPILKKQFLSFLKRDFTMISTTYSKTIPNLQPVNFYIMLRQPHII